MWRVLSIDPGNDTGWSYWEDGRLTGCGLGSPPWEGMAPDVVVIEVPEIYPGGPHARDLIVLAMNAGRHIQRVWYLGAPCLGVYPAQWKGQNKKTVHHGRVKAAIGPMNLAYAESRLIGLAESKKHNVWDGIALGHWTIVQAMTGAKLGMSPIKTLQSLTNYQFRKI